MEKFIPTQENVDAQKNSVELLERAEGTKIANQAEYGLNVNIIRELKKKWKTVEEARKKMKKPADDTVKEIQDFFNPILSAYKQAENKLRGLLGDYDTEQARIRKEAQDKIDKDLKEKKDKTETAAIEARENNNEAAAVSLEIQSNALPQTGVQLKPSKVQGVSKTTVYEYTVANLGQVPRNFLMINDKAIKSFITATKGEMPIEGISITSRERANIR